MFDVPEVAGSATQRRGDDNVSYAISSPVMFRAPMACPRAWAGMVSRLLT